LFFSCHSFNQVDVTAEAFGKCLCGRAKAEHDAKALVRQSSGKVKFVTVAKEATGACVSYQVNVTAEKFGTCICGFPKTAHAATTAGPAKATGKAAFVAVEKVATGACDNYSIDVHAAKFGQCLCGLPKTAHAIYDGDGPVLKALKAEEALKAEKAQRKQQKRREDEKANRLLEANVPNAGESVCVPNSFCAVC
jgi:hypothetical protein